MRWCAFGKHRVFIEECQTEDGAIRATCTACRTRLQERTAVAALAREQADALRNEYDEAANDDNADGVQAEPVDVDEFDGVFGDGNDLMDIDLPDDCAVSAREQELLRVLDEKLADIKYETCNTCLEEAFDMHVKDGMCAACSRDKEDPVRKWSAENGVHPGIYCFSTSKYNIWLICCLILALDIPPCLKGLTDMEEMLISRVKVCMQVRWTKGRQLCYQDHIVNFHQDITQIAQKLPRLPEDTDIVIIRKEDVDMSRHVDFIVRRAKIKAALEYKIAHDPEYADLTLDEEVIAQLPDGGSVVDRLPFCIEGRQDGGGAAMPAGPDDAAAAAGVDDIENDNDQYVGGVVDLGNHERPEVEILRQGAAAVASGTPYEQTIVSRICKNVSNN
jgi:hypothetical protein